MLPTSRTRDYPVPLLQCCRLLNPSHTSVNTNVVGFANPAISPLQLNFHPAKSRIQSYGLLSCASASDEQSRNLPFDLVNLQSYAILSCLVILSYCCDPGRQEAWCSSSCRYRQHCEYRCSASCSRMLRPAAQTRSDAPVAPSYRKAETAPN
jgi:hypothetical protein